MTVQTTPEATVKEHLENLRRLANQCYEQLIKQHGNVEVLIKFALHIEQEAIEHYVRSRYVPPQKSWVTPERLDEIQRRHASGKPTSSNPMQEIDVLRQQRADLLEALTNAILRIEHEEAWAAIAFQDSNTYQEGKNAALGELLLSLDHMWMDYKARRQEEAIRAVQEVRKLVEQRLDGAPMPPHERTLWKCREMRRLLELALRPGATIVAPGLPPSIRKEISEFLEKHG